MPNYQVISQASHGDKRWLRYTSYAFAMKEAVMPLQASELHKAMMSLPIGFIAKGESFVPAAVMSLQPERNLCVMPDGRWIGPYVPSAFRAYPFCLANTTDGQQVLCIDEDSGLVTDGLEGEAFFDEMGNPSAAVTAVLDFITQIESNRLATLVACTTLAKHNLIQPWPITVNSDTGVNNIEGLYRIDEALLNHLPVEPLQEVRNAGALPIAYCQLLSMQHLPLLSKLAEAHAVAQQLAPNDELDVEFLNKEGTISFAGIF